MHTNPTFFKKRNGIVEILEKENEIKLSIGDSFGLLPDLFWFCIHDKTDNEKEACDRTTESIQNDKPVEQNIDVTVSVSNDLKRKSSEDDESNNMSKKAKHDTNQCDNERNGETSNRLVNRSNETSPGPSVQQQTENDNTKNKNIDNQPVDESSKSSTSHETNMNANRMDEVTSTSNPTVVSPPNNDSNEQNALLNRPIKTELVDTSDNIGRNNDIPTSFITVKKEFKTEVKTEPQNDDDNNEASSSNTNQTPARQCCRYGIRCYRYIMHICFSIS